MSYTLDDERVLELKIRNRRRVMIIQICMFLLIVIVEGGINYMLYATRSQGYGPDTIRDKLIRYWGITSALNAGAIILGMVFQKIASSRPKLEFLENYALMFPIIVICTNVAYSHYQFAGTFGVFVLAITITTIFEDVYADNIANIYKELIGSIKNDLRINTRFFMDFEDIKDVLDRDAGCTVKELEKAHDIVASSGDFENIFITEASATVSCNCGPNTVGVLYVYHD